MSLKGACDKLESAFADAESKLDRVNEKVDLQIAKANQPGEHIVSCLVSPKLLLPPELT